MKKLKSIIACCLLVILSCTCFVACKKDNDDGKDKGPSVEEQVMTRLNTIQNKMAQETNYTHTYSSYYIDENDIRVDTEHNNPTENNGVSEIVTNIVNGKEVSFVKGSEGFDDYYETSQKINNEIISKVYNVEEKYYIATTLTPKQFAMRNFSSFRIDVDFDDVVSTLKNEYESEKVAFKKDIVDNVEKLTITQTKISEEVSVVFVVSDDKITSFSYTRKWSVMVNENEEPLYRTICVNCDVAYTADSLDFDDSVYVDFEFDAGANLKLLKNTLTSIGMRNHIVTETKSNEIVSVTKFLTTSTLDKLQVIDDVDGTTILYKEIEPGEESNVMVRTYDLTQQKYSEQTTNKTSVQAHYSNTFVELNLIKEMIKAMETENVEFSLTMDGEAYIYNARQLGDDGFEVELIVNGIDIISFRNVERSGGNEVESIYTVQYTEPEIDLDVSGFTRV